VRGIVGVDGGTTKTIALVAGLDGAIRGTGRDGGSNIYVRGGIQRALAAVERAVMDAVRAAGMNIDDLVAGVFSMSGADWPEDVISLRRAMEWRRFGRSVRVVNDALGALRAGSPDGTGVVVVCGTGAAIGARGANGRAWHSGFWQEGGGSRGLARKMRRAVYRAALGLDPATALTARALDIYEQPGVEEILHALTARDRRPMPIDLTGRVARALLDEAERGDAMARRIVREHGALLGDYAVVAARQVGLGGDSFPLVLTGGVLRHRSPLLSEAIVARVRLEAVEARPIASRFEPAVGALFLALEDAGVVVDDDLLERSVMPTLPPDTLYHT